MQLLKNNIHIIYNMKFFNNLVPKQLYISNKHNSLAVIFVLFIILVVQYPYIFSKSANTVLGKAILLAVIVLLTNYNTLIGLTAALVIIVFYIYLFDTGFEGLEVMDKESPKPEGSHGNPMKSPPANINESNKPLNDVPPDKVHVVATKTDKVPEETSQTDKMLIAKTITAPQNSKTIPYTPIKNSSVAPADPNGLKKTTNAALKPSSAVKSQ
jgi:hypothetical protein